MNQTTRQLHSTSKERHGTITHKIKKELSICQSLLCLDLRAMMMTMTTLAEGASNISLALVSVKNHRDNSEFLCSVQSRPADLDFSKDL